uniref:Uncharacterized protein n=1 Tax=Heterorhabditis bacteriophora TaxID=37862 RepID=A0A1I7WTB6_HETBA
MNKIPMVGSLQRKEMCFGGKVHLNTGMRIIILCGALLILLLVGLLYLKFKKAIFILLIPTIVIVLTVFGITSKKDRLMWPIISISLFHVVSSCYALLIFSFYFFFKPFYIIMILNWAFDTLHTDKTPSYYIQCGGIFIILTLFLLFNAWQASVSISYRTLLIRERRNITVHQPTVLIINRPQL